jgi:hypothetical protein
MHNLVSSPADADPAFESSLTREAPSVEGTMGSPQLLHGVKRTVAPALEHNSRIWF